MSNSTDTLKSILKQAGCSLTKPRLLVFDAMIGKESMTMSELIKYLNKQIDRASAYRTVHIFEEAGIVQRLYTGWKYKIELTDLFADHHHHLTCSNCGRIIPINEHGLEDFIRELAHQYNFQPRGHQLEVQGLCLDCQAVA